MGARTSQLQSGRGTNSSKPLPVRMNTLRQIKAAPEVIPSHSHLPTPDYSKESSSQPAEDLTPSLAAELLELLLDTNAVRHEKVISLLQSSRPDLTLDASGLKPIHVAVVTGNMELLRQVLETRGTDANARAAGLTALHLAAQYLNPAAVRELLNHPLTHINSQTTLEQQTPLMVALSTDHKGPDEDRLEIIQTILENEQCHLDQQDTDGWIALTYAARTGNWDAGWLLLAEERSQVYTIDQLLNACRVAYLSGNEAFCDILMQSITDGQRAEIRKKITALKENCHTTPLLRSLLKDAQQWLEPSGPTVENHPSWDNQDQLLQVGSIVLLHPDKVAVRKLQKDIGGWLDSLENVSGQRGIVRSISQDGVLAVDFGYFRLVTSDNDNRLRYVNPKVVKRLSQDDYNTHDIDGTMMSAGDVVRLFSDRETVAQCQSRFGDYDSNMDQLLGQPGVLKYYDHKCDPVVVIAGQEWLIDAQALRKVTTVECADGKLAQVGSRLDLSSNKSTFKHLQSSEVYGGWNEKMVTVLGKEGVVTHIGCSCYVITARPDCFLTVRVGHVEMDVNPKLLTVTSDDDKTLIRLPQNGVGVHSHRDQPQYRDLGQKGSSHPESDQKSWPTYDSFSQSGEEDAVDKRISRQNSGKPVLNLQNGSDAENDGEINSTVKLPLATSLSVSSEDSKVSSVMSQLQSYAKTIPFDQLKEWTKIGAGGFATVYRVRWNAAYCAVKVIKMDNMKDMQGNTDGEVAASYDIWSEAKFHSQFMHPHIVQFLGVAFNPSDPVQMNAYMVMRFVDGYNLDKAIFKRKVPMTRREKVDITLQIADAIRYLHEDAHVIHKDIKPQNILIDKYSKQAYVTDFGISNAYHDTPIQTMLALYTKDACGSVPYMAPELVIVSKRNSMYRRPTPKSDIWSLGATLVELFTEKHLYGAENPDLHTLLNFKQDQTLPKAMVEAPEHLKRVLQPCLDKQPDKRPSASKLLNMLDEHEKAMLNGGEESDV
ncbi:hypothetical protein RvY_16270 [Ramazzottius varieornatus]|uniref:RING-type E3 ubiquitin transferase n=1 Tax=Ramazzottius varieornatus TaxID=947166 RepID=A0A1D1VXW2_RAMVA|nr:hypothetical protein RvY_16270 [Ramazzottius varieornatus]